MALLQHTVKRRNPTTAIYADNYGYTINFYQPMIDYLDAKQKGSDAQYPHLPWSNERGLKEYWPCKTVKTYSIDDIEKYSSKVAENAKHREQGFEDYKIIYRSPLAVTKSAIGNRLSFRLRKLSFETIGERAIQELEAQANKRHFPKVMDDNDNIETGFIASKNLEISSGLKNAIRGRTANQISAALLAESEKNIKVARNHENLFVKESIKNGKTKIIARNFEIIDNRLIDNLDKSVCSSLYNVKRQLQSFNQRSSDFYFDSRWRKHNI